MLCFPEVFQQIMTAIVARARPDDDDKQQNNRNVIITQRFHAAPVQANLVFFWPADCIFQL